MSDRGENNQSTKQKSRRVFFVDDEANFLNGLKLRLRHLRKKWQMEFFENAKTALEALKPGLEVVIVSDWMMPNMDGLAFCKEVKQSNRNQGLYYFILVTGRGDSEDVVTALDTGADDFVSKPFEIQELTARIRVGHRFLDLQRDLRDANKCLKILASKDRLTNLYNRGEGVEILSLELERVKRDSQSLCVMMIDLDHFKKINDTYGHDAGDEVLKEVSKRLIQQTRKYDSVIRWGGEEMLLIFPHTKEFNRELIAERIRNTIASKPFKINEEKFLGVTSTIGTAYVCSGMDCTGEKIVKMADEKLYEAKHLGRNRACHANPVKGI